MLQKMVERGVDMIDVGGESSRPGFTPVSVADEINRVVPIIAAIRGHRDVAISSIPISIDTYKAEVARAAVNAGASVVNDISAGLFDPVECFEGEETFFSRAHPLVALAETRRKCSRP